MKRLIPALLLIVLFSSCKDKGTEYHVFYLGGQSNMDGYGYNKDLEAKDFQLSDSVPIFHGNTGVDGAEPDGRGVWAMLRPGHGAGFKADTVQNYYSGRFGVELTFASTMQELNPGIKIALIKYSRGGTSIDQDAAGFFGSWDPHYKDGDGRNQYDHFLATIANSASHSDIDGDGIPDRLIPSGILWMQGESDANVSEEIASRYLQNLAELMGLIRKAFGTDNTPVVIGLISDSGNNPSGKVWKYGDIVRDAQAKYADTDANAALVRSTDTYSYSDPWHYDSDGFIDLGKEFAQAMDSLIKRN
ncbi:MAG: sialate O-acetylesterase [Marinilabiliaceae bacterium]|jgi:hypothetical protein|nr:sialate O-acetylesterase [Marinilabiliaceae bacterium]